MAETQELGGVGLEVRGAARVLVGWHLLSLDAPVVAVVWTWFAGRVEGAPVRWSYLATMFVAVWMLYAADRLLDARRGDGLEERHRFHARHWRGFLVGLGVGAVMLMGLVARMSVREVEGNLLLGAALAGWLLVVHTGGAGRLAKEWMVGVFFAAAVFLPGVLAGRPVWLDAGVFGAVCVLNCLSIAGWEHGVGAGARRWVLAGVLVGACVGADPVCGACALAAGLLFGLDRTQERLRRTELRALADVALLTPVVFLLW